MYILLILPWETIFTSKRNPLTPVPPVTARDEPWAFFLFWRHHFWPNLAPSILNFCRRKRSFQWCPNQSDQPNGALDMNKNAQKVEWKTQSKISCHYTWLLHTKNCPSRWRFLRASTVEGQSLQQKEEKRRGRKGEKKFQKSKSLKTQVTFSSKILISAHARVTMH